ncbi:hypothetical protein [Oceanobacillus jeddahense]|uniref:hypothetical protein n=1 Tax=Oceanobacillus jeddahense TaxID=1462527 RepID=UPI000ADD8D22|nr:hypothetical protein [Oceanobacillus jeddahense]
MSHYQLTFFIGISNGIQWKTSKKQILKRCEGKKIYNNDVWLYTLRNDENLT